MNILFIKRRLFGLMCGIELCLLNFDEGWGDGDGYGDTEGAEGNSVVIELSEASTSRAFEPRYGDGNFFGNGGGDGSGVRLWIA